MRLNDEEAALNMAKDTKDRYSFIPVWGRDRIVTCIVRKLKDSRCLILFGATG